MRRALRYDGVLPQTSDPAAIRDIAAYVARERPADLRDRPFEIVVEGRTPIKRAAAVAKVRPVADAGATWWIESNWETATVEFPAGPPRGRPAERLSEQRAAIRPRPGRIDRAASRPRARRRSGRRG